MLNLKKNFDITNFSNFKTKAIAKYFFEINNLSDIKKLKEIINFQKKNNLWLLFIWAWTNMLFAFEYYDGIVIKNNLFWWKYDKKTKELFSYSWEMISDIAEILEKKFDQKLWHRFIWLPWTIWWAIYWNAWCFWLEAENNFKEAKVYNFQKEEIEILNKEKMKFSYRSSILKEKGFYFLIKLTFDLSKKIEKYNSDVDNIEFREVRQPKWNTCWSFFKNPSKEDSAWKLIEKIWFKWYFLNWAWFSSLHANFLMNDWTATYKDLLNLIKITQKKVKQKFNIELIPEVKIIYNSEKKCL